MQLNIICAKNHSFNFGQFRILEKSNRILGVSLICFPIQLLAVKAYFRVGVKLGEDLKGWVNVHAINIAYLKRRVKFN